ncbi:MAG: GyrI-like domain-containing protein [Oscillospiraceae bacterium]|nr:GyrI-like domain-containing protein [Oscillospiraceae bacterium]
MGFETSKNTNVPESWIAKTIPARKYTKFTINGNMSESAYKFWQNLWQIDLPRKFVCDFEECENMDM